MNWNETTASRCRYGDVAETIWGDWDIIWEDSMADYQGHASFVAAKDGKYSFYEWHYGSCSGCDGWEAAGLSDKQIADEMKDSALWLNGKAAMLDWLERLEGGNPISNYSMEAGGGLTAGLDILGGGLLGRINAIRAHFGMEPYRPQ